MNSNKLGFKRSNQRYNIEEQYEIDQCKQSKSDQLIVAIGLVKNEADIIEIWLGHLCSLFDLVYLIDHNSTDGTYEIIMEAAKKTGKIRLFNFHEPGDFQKEIMHEVIKSVSKEYQNAWIFPCDADEFYPFDNQQQFRQAVLENRKDNILQFIWKNCLPLSLLLDQRIGSSTLVLKPPFNGDYHKVAFHSSNYLSKRWQIVKGNHDLIGSSGDAVSGIPRVDMGALLHFPIRSVDQFVYKLIRGYKGKKNLPKNLRNPDESFHFKDMMTRVIEEGFITPQLVRNFIVNYGVKTSPSSLATKSIRDLINESWNYGYLGVSNISLDINLKQREKYSSLMEKELLDDQDEFLGQFLNSILDIGVHSC